MSQETDYMDQFSIPVKTDDHGVFVVYHMNPRRDPKKPGRELVVGFDRRHPLIEGFKVNYSYYVRFLEKGNVAGNHYHEKKNEIMIPIVGSFEIKSEDIETKQRRSVQVSADVPTAIYVKRHVSHSVKATEVPSVLLVLATSPNNDGDEYPHPIVW